MSSFLVAPQEKRYAPDFHMRIITPEQLEQNPALYDEIVQMLRDDGLVCFPGHRHYSIAASLTSQDAVIKLVQSKHRSGKAPSLVLIPDFEALGIVVEEVPEIAATLARAFWPGPLTLRMQPSSELPGKVRKTIADKKQARIGVRVPAPGHALEILRRFGAPLLISSANLSNKVGSSSASNVRKNFNHTVDAMIDAGDIPDRPPSTVVEIADGQMKVTREGKITAAQVEEALLDAS